MPTDRELIDRVRAGDAEAFEAVFKLHAAGVRGRILAVVRDGDTADDLVQEVFLRLWTKAEQWEGRGTLVGWLMLIGFNLALNHLRGVRRRHEQPLEGPDDQVPDWMVDTASLGPEARAEMSEEMALYRSLLGQLSEEQQEVVRMVHEAGMEIRDVAEELEIAPGTVKSRLHYARQRLAKDWKDISGEGGDR